MKKARKLGLCVLMCMFLLCGCGQDAALEPAPELEQKTVPEQKPEAVSQQDSYALGSQYLEEGRYEEAIEAFTAALEHAPEQALTYVGRGDAYVLSSETEGNLKAALADYEAALALDETLVPAWLGLADVYIRQGDFDRALEILQEGLEKTGGDQTISDKIAEIEAGNIIDSSGNIHRMNGYNSDGELAWYHIFEYDGMRQTSVTAYDASGNQISYMELLYDEEGRKLNSYSYLSETGELDGCHTYEYDSSGNMIKSEYAKLGEEPSLYEVFEYNSEGICTGSQQYQYDTAGDFLLTSSEYDELGNIARITWYDFNGNVSGYYIYQCDSDGKYIRYDSYNVDGELQNYVIWIYDDDDNCIGQEYYNADGSLEFSSVNES